MEAVHSCVKQNCFYVQWGGEFMWKKKYVFVESVGGEYLCRSHGGALNASKKTTYFSFWALVGGGRV